MYITKLNPNEKIDIDVTMLFNTKSEVEDFINIMRGDLPDVEWAVPEEIVQRNFVLDSSQKTEMAFDVNQRAKETIKWLKEKYLGEC